MVRSSRFAGSVPIDLVVRGPLVTYDVHVVGVVGVVATSTGGGATGC